VRREVSADGSGAVLVESVGPVAPVKAQIFADDPTGGSSVCFAADAVSFQGSCP